MMKFTATENILLIDAVANLAPDSSKSTHRAWIKEGRVYVDDLPCKHASISVCPNQTVTLGPRPRYAEGNIPILYEDPHLVVIHKPEGILSVATTFQKEKTAHAFLKSKYYPRRVYPVHRLDQETSGLMLFALSEKGRDRLKKMLENHEIERTYYAIVEGKVAPAEGTWQTYQQEDANYYVHNSNAPSHGKIAITRYKVKKMTKHYTFLELQLETGRKNQIRAHCQWAGCPIAGDKKYGAATNPAKRVCLHAYSLTFTHPLTGKKMAFKSPLPEVFDRILHLSK